MSKFKAQKSPIFLHHLFTVLVIITLKEVVMFTTGESGQVLQISNHMKVQLDPLIVNLEHKDFQFGILLSNSPNKIKDHILLKLSKFMKDMEVNSIPYKLIWIIIWTNPKILKIKPISVEFSKLMQCKSPSELNAQQNQKVMVLYTGKWTMHGLQFHGHQ